MKHLEEIKLHLSPELAHKLRAIAGHRQMSLDQLILTSLVTYSEEFASEASHSFAHRLDCIEKRLSMLEAAAPTS
jgi:hypothetical protein